MHKVLFGTEALDALLQQLGIGLQRLADRGLGNAVTDHHSSWVRRVVAGKDAFYIKTYDYPSIASRLRGLLRNTGPWRPSRAAREAQAFRWLQQHGFGAPTAIAVVEGRRLGCLRWAMLITTEWPGEPLDHLLHGLAPADRTALVAALVAFVRELHRAGFRDRNLDLRNLLARRRQDGAWQVAKLDSPRFQLRASGSTSDALARADWARLLPQLEALGCAPADFTP